MLKIIKDTVAPRNKHTIWLNLNTLLFMIWIKTKWVSVGTATPQEIIDSDTLLLLLDNIKDWVNTNYTTIELLESTATTLNNNILLKLSDKADITYVNTILNKAEKDILEAVNSLYVTKDDIIYSKREFITGAPDPWGLVLNESLYINYSPLYLNKGDLIYSKAEFPQLFLTTSTLQVLNVISIYNDNKGKQVIPNTGNYYIFSDIAHTETIVVETPIKNVISAIDEKVTNLEANIPTEVVTITEDLNISGHKTFTTPITATDLFINNKIRFNKDNLRPYVGLNDTELSIKSDRALKLEAGENIGLTANNKVNITSNDSNINLGDGNIDFYSPSFIFSTSRNSDKSIVKIESDAIVTNVPIKIAYSKELMVGDTVIRDDNIKTTSLSLEKIYTPNNKHLSITSTDLLKLLTSSNNSIAIQEDNNRINLVSPELRWVLKPLTKTVDVLQTYSDDGSLIELYIAIKRGYSYKIVGIMENTDYGTFTAYDTYDKWVLASPMSNPLMLNEGIRVYEISPEREYLVSDIIESINVDNISIKNLLDNNNDGINYPQPRTIIEAINLLYNKVIYDAPKDGGVYGRLNGKWVSSLKENIVSITKGVYSDFLALDVPPNGYTPTAEAELLLYLTGDSFLVVLYDKGNYCIYWECTDAIPSSTTINNIATVINCNGHFYNYMARGLFKRATTKPLRAIEKEYPIPEGDFIPPPSQHLGYTEVKSGYALIYIGPNNIYYEGMYVVDINNPDAVPSSRWRDYKGFIGISSEELNLEGRIVIVDTSIYCYNGIKWIKIG